MRTYVSGSALGLPIQRLLNPRGHIVRNLEGIFSGPLGIMKRDAPHRGSDAFKRHNNSSAEPAAPCALHLGLRVLGAGSILCCAGLIVPGAATVVSTHRGPEPC